MLVFEKQLEHLLALLALLAGLYLVIDDSSLAGAFLGWPTSTWLYLSVAISILHQLYVWLMWRTQLHLNLLTNLFGERAFMIYAVGFTIFFVSRPLSVIGLAIANRYTLPISPLLPYTLAAIFAVLAGYVFYSIRKYFSLTRAYGIDHFDPAYRNKEFVRQGIFRWSDNAMYKFGFLGIWIPGLLLLSKAALLIALFNHLYIWVHYYCTELPDIKRIYG